MGHKVKLWNRHYQKMKGQISPAQKRQLKKLLYRIRRHTPEKISLIGMQFFWNGRRAVRPQRQSDMEALILDNAERLFSGAVRYGKH